MHHSNPAQWQSDPALDERGLSWPKEYDPKRAAMMLRDLANPCRLAVLSMLCDGERSVGALEARLDMSQSALSQHLARLRRARLVRTRRDQQKIYYALVSPELAPVIRMIGVGCVHLCRQTRETPGEAGGEAAGRKPFAEAASLR